MRDMFPPPFHDYAQLCVGLLQNQSYISVFGCAIGRFQVLNGFASFSHWPVMDG